MKKTLSLIAGAALALTLVIGPAMASAATVGTTASTSVTCTQGALVVNSSSDEHHQGSEWANSASDQYTNTDTNANKGAETIVFNWNGNGFIEHVTSQNNSASSDSTTHQHDYSSAGSAGNYQLNSYSNTRFNGSQSNVTVVTQSGSFFTLL